MDGWGGGHGWMRGKREECEMRMGMGLVGLDCILLVTSFAAGKAQNVGNSNQLFRHRPFMSFQVSDTCRRCPSGQVKSSDLTRKDRSQTSVSSLLALLRSAQDGEGEGEGEAGQSSAAASGAARAPAQNSNAHVNTPPPAQPSATGALGRNSHLSALLAQLAPSLPPPAAAPSSTHRGSAFEGPSRDLLEPFGPVGRTPAPRAQRRVSGEGSGEGTPRRPSEAESEAATPWPDKGKRKADEMEDRADWSFTRCLPVLTDLLRDDEFVKEVRKVGAKARYERPAWNEWRWLGARSELEACASPGQGLVYSIPSGASSNMLTNNRANGR